MSLIRQDPSTKEWVIISTERAKRPHDFAKAGPSLASKAREAHCPFCPGNEGATPKELYRIPDAKGDGWTVRVVPNKFAALSPGGELRRKEDSALFREMSGVGAHEVVVETPVHNRSIPLMKDAEVEDVLLTYVERYRVLREDPSIRYIIIFKNHGEAAGTSLEHPHSQIIGTPIAPQHTRRKYAVALSYHDDTGRCLYSDIVAAELKEKDRIIEETGRYVVFHPFASKSPFETWIVPKAQQPSFGQLSRGEIGELASVLKKNLLALYHGLGNPAYNFIVHTASFEDETKPYFLWHLQILPRLTTIAGFELGSGISITTVAPEDSAVFIRDIAASLRSKN